MQQPQNNAFVFFRRYDILIIFLIAALLLLSGIGASPIYILDEARNAQAAREMMEKHEWIVPTFNAELRAHKPPLHYYFMRASYSLFGVNPWGARFFSAVMGWLTIWITWFFTRRFLNVGAALWSAVVLLLSTHFLFEFQLAVPDPYLIFFTTAGIWCFYAFITEQKLKWLLASAVATALATLSKGPVAIALPGAAIAGWLLVQKQFKQVLSWKIVLFLAVLLAIAIPWYIAVHKATHGQFTKDFFLTHNLDRFGGAMEGHGGIFLMVPLFVLIGLLPLSVFIGETTKSWKVLRQHPFTLLCMFVVAAFVVFFSISGTKLPNYPMPCYPFLAVLLGHWIYKAIEEQKKVKQYPFWLLLLLNTLFLTGAFIALGLETATRSFRGWAFVFMVLVLTSTLAWRMFRTKGLHKALITLAAGYICFNLLFIAVAYPAIYRQNPVAKTLHLLHPDEQVYSWKIYNPAYNFYLNKPVIVFHDKAAIEQLIRQHPEAKIISREDDIRQLEGIPLQLLAKERDLFETATTVIVRPSRP